ncbi:MAG: hypothetical protein SPF83_06150, partial [Butyricimonas virosa]|uniref:hypothetical protein n=1 Tax=Butyricimonas virosa TaxID=544645 RepID=UPI002A91A243
KSKKIFEITPPPYTNLISSPVILYYPSSYYHCYLKHLISIMDRLLIGTTDKPILDYKKSNYLVLRDMKKDRN